MNSLNFEKVAYLPSFTLPEIEMFTTIWKNGIRVVGSKEELCELIKERFPTYTKYNSLSIQEVTALLALSNRYATDNTLTKEDQQKIYMLQLYNVWPKLQLFIGYMAN